MADVRNIEDVAEDGLPSGHVARVVSQEGICGRVRYTEVGWMWRARSSNTCFVSPDGSYERRRYLPHGTLLAIEKEEAPQG